MSTKLQLNTYYHVYQRGNNRQTIFFKRENYLHFMRLYAKYIAPIAATYAYSLLPNHGHFAIRTFSEAEQRAYYEKTCEETCEVSKTSQVSPFKFKEPSRQFSHLFNAYAKGINKQEKRTGGLYEGRFGRKPVTTDRYFYNLITYIHRNPQKHGFVDDFRDWPYSSYHAILSDKPTRVERTAVLDWFGGGDNFIEIHQTDPDERPMVHLLDDDL